MLFCFHEIIYKMIFVFYRARAKMTFRNNKISFKKNDQPLFSRDNSSLNVPARAQNLRIFSHQKISWKRRRCMKIRIGPNIITQVLQKGFSTPYIYYIVHHDSTLTYLLLPFYIVIDRQPESRACFQAISHTYTPRMMLFLYLVMLKHLSD